MLAANRRDLYLQVNGNVDSLTAASKAGRSALVSIGDAATDVQAEVAKAFADMGAKAPAQAKLIEQSYSATFAKIGSNLRAVRDAPTGAQAGAILNANAGKQAADQAQRAADALRINADAAGLVAMRQGEAGGAARVLAAALEAQAQAATVQAQRLQTQATLLAEVDQEMRSGAGGAVLHAEAEREAAAALAATAEAADRARQKVAALNTEQAARAREEVAGDAARGRFDAVLAAPGNGSQFATVNLDRSSGQARGSASVFEEQAKAEADAARGAEELERRVVALRSAIDPAYAAQRRFDAELVDARDLVSRGAISLDEYCARLRQITPSAEGVAAAHGRMGIAGMEAEHVVRALSDSVAAGRSPFQALAMESGRISESLTLWAATTDNTEGKLGKLAAFMGGPWGIAASVALAVLAPLVGEMIEGGDAAEEEAQKLKDNAKQAAAADAAKAAFIKTEAGAIDSIRQVTDQLKDQNEALKTNAERMRDKVQQDLGTLQTARPAAAQKVADAEAAVNRALQADSGTMNGRAYATQLASARADLADAKAELTKIDTAIAQGRAAMATSQKNLAGEAAERDADPATAIKYKYEGAGGLIDAAKKHATAEEAVNGVLERRLKLLDEAEAKELKAAAAADREKKPPSLGAQVEAEQGRQLLTSAESFRGLSETKNKGQLEDLFHTAGINVDPQITAWCAAFVNAVLATNGFKGNGQLNARSFLSYGSATSRPEQGDIVVVRRGTGGQGHVGFYQGTDAQGRVEVLGGNTGDKVGTEHVALGDVLGFRRVTAKGDDEAARRAQAEQDKATRDTEAYAQQLGRAQEETLKLQRDQVTDYRAAADLDVQEVEAERQRLNGAAQAGADERKWTQAQADALIAQNDINAALKDEAVRRKELAQQVEQQFTAGEHARAARDAIAQIDSELASTRGERYAIEQGRLASRQASTRAGLNKVLDDPTATVQQKDQAVADLGALPGQEDAQRRQLAHQYQDPLSSYRDQLEQHVGDMNDAMEGVAADGLKDVQDGLGGILSGTETVAQGFKRMSASIISDLERIAVEKIILSIFGLKDGGEAPSPLHLAGGGAVFGPGGPRDDRVPAMLSHGEFVINAASYARHSRLVRAINDNELPGFANGGLLGRDIATLAYPALPSAASVARPAPAPQVIYVQVDKSELFDTHVARVAAPMAQAAMVGGAQQAQQDMADRQRQAIPV